MAVAVSRTAWCTTSAAPVADLAPGASVQMGLLLDPLTNVMLVVVTGVSLMVQIYSMAYMDGDESFARYYAYMSLFSASMIGLVLASNIVQMYVFWELVGLSSYLLIGFWHERPSGRPRRKRRSSSRASATWGSCWRSFPLLPGGRLRGAGSERAAHSRHLDGGGSDSGGRRGHRGRQCVAVAVPRVFAGRGGKSGQFPLHTWLPDAMEGPTPSAP